MINITRTLPSSGGNDGGLPPPRESSRKFNERWDMWDMVIDGSNWPGTEEEIGQGRG